MMILIGKIVIGLVVFAWFISVERRINDLRNKVAWLEDE